MKEKLDVDIIDEYIKSNHLTVKEFCKRCRISTSTFYRIKGGKNFDLTSLFKIAFIMKKPIHQYFKMID